MKRKHEERSERRRPGLEPNLAGESSGNRSPIGRRGCASLFGRVLLLALVLVLCLAIGAGLR